MVFHGVGSPELQITKTDTASSSTESTTRLNSIFDGLNSDSRSMLRVIPRNEGGRHRHRNDDCLINRTQKVGIGIYTSPIF